MGQCDLGMDDDVKVRRCLCGEKAELIQLSWGTQSEWRVVCSIKGCWAGPQGSKKVAVETWNKRVSEVRVKEKMALRNLLR